MLFTSSPVWSETFHSPFEPLPVTAQPNTDRPAEQIAALFAEQDRLRQIVELGGWSNIQPAQPLELGVVDPAVEHLRERLIYGGDLAPSLWHSEGSFDAQTFDMDVLQAVIRFQSRHGLKADGVVGRQTLQALNVPVEQRLNQLEINLNRWQSLAPELQGDYLLVNIPEFKLRLFDNDQLTLDMRVVVGKRRSPTPELVEELEYLVVNPYWYVPSRISRYELLPKVQADPSYLAQRRYAVYAGDQYIDSQTIAWDQVSADNFEYKIRQLPGPQNSLGAVKFIFPNPRNIYLHDTPVKQHFELDRRAYSHGCVRVEEPWKLAQAILAMQNGWQADHIQHRLGVDYTSRLELDTPLQVRLAYLTNWAHNGVVHYYEDIYRRDALPSNPAPIQPQLAEDVQQYLAATDAPPPQQPSESASQPLVWSSTVQPLR